MKRKKSNKETRGWGCRLRNSVYGKTCGYAVSGLKCSSLKTNKSLSAGNQQGCLKSTTFCKMFPDKDWQWHLAFKVLLWQYNSDIFRDINHKFYISLAGHYTKHLPRSTLTCMDGSMSKLSAFLLSFLFHRTRTRIPCKCWGFAIFDEADETAVTAVPSSLCSSRKWDYYGCYSYSVWK